MGYHFKIDKLIFLKKTKILSVGEPVTDKNVLSLFC